LILGVTHLSRSFTKGGLRNGELINDPQPCPVALPLSAA
jgi:hypothetical protein